MSNEWIKVGKTSDFTADLGGCVKVGEEQIAVYNVKEKSEWYAVQNLCPHDNRMVLSRGIIGDCDGMENPLTLLPPLGLLLLLLL